MQRDLQAHRNLMNFDKTLIFVRANPEEEMAPGSPVVSCPCLKGDCKKEGEGLFTKTRKDKGQRIQTNRGWA